MSPRVRSHGPHTPSIDLSKMTDETIESVSTKARAGSREDGLASRNPLTGAVLGRVPILGAEEVRQLVSRARRAQAEWAARSPRERARALQRLRRIVADRADEIGGLIRSETGKVMGEALGAEVLVSCDYLAYLADLLPRALRGRKAGTGWLPHRRARVTYEPYGVVGAITPWNYPFTLSMGAAATAIAAGNAVILKPSEHTPLTGRLVGELIAEATDLVDLVPVATGDGGTGAALVSAGVDKVAFTGSVASGRKVMAAAAETLTPVVLELGGKDAMIVCEDADIERAARGAVWAGFYGAGEICQSVERVYVLEPVYDSFVQAVVAAARRVRASDEPESMIGSLIAPFQVETVESHVRDARDRGARVLLGGRRIEGSGHFFEPTVIVDVDHEMQVMRSETFGPVLPIMKVADEEEAIRWANDSDYGLDASVWSRDRARARRIGDRLDVGSVLINDHLINYALADLPFGGRKNSGFGRVHGLEGVREFVRPKSWVEDRFAFARELHWFREGGSGEELARSLLGLYHGRGVVDRVKGGLDLLRRILGR